MEVKDRWSEKVKWGEIEPPDEPRDEYIPGWDAIYHLQGDGYDPEGRISFVDELRLDFLALTRVVDEGHDLNM